ncbi:unknown protein encoded by prophage CP-933C [Escherichia coli O157:H7 str. EDL933]|uniref:Uncharacterized protein n=1 Tax=Escherichia coli O157:H7 TaxID=83334 RepID=Q8X3P6_ECO57|nr:unknown protein encoded by prophage CP-933C [Escherichia coli O157:H7 str. EDL933]
MEFHFFQGDKFFCHFSAPSRQRISRRVLATSGNGCPMIFSTRPASGPVLTFIRLVALMSFRYRIQILTVPIASSAPDEMASLLLIMFTLAQSV